MGNWWNNWSGPSTLGPHIGLGPFGSWLERQIPVLGEDVGQLISDWWNSGERQTTSVSGQPPSQAPQMPSSGGDLSQLLQQLGGAGAAGASGSGASNQYITPDDVTITDGSPEDRYYRMADAVWTKIFGAHPDFAQARVFHDMGAENTDQLTQIVLQMPSHIKMPDGAAINIGTYEDILTTGNKFAQQYLGRPIPDSLISQWVASGVTTPAAIENWFWSHPANDIPKDQYAAVWDVANQWTQQVAGAFRG